MPNTFVSGTGWECNVLGEIRREMMHAPGVLVFHETSISPDVSKRVRCVPMVYPHILIASVVLAPLLGCSRQSADSDQSATKTHAPNALANIDEYLAKWDQFAQG